MSVSQIPKSIGLNTQVRPSFKQHTCNALFTIKLGYDSSDTREKMHNPLTLMLASLGGGGSGNGGEGRADPSIPFHSRMIRAEFLFKLAQWVWRGGGKGGEESEDTHHRQNQAMNNEEIDKCTQ